MAQCGGGTGGEKAAEEGAVCFEPSSLEPEKSRTDCIYLVNS